MKEPDSFLITGTKYSLRKIDWDFKQEPLGLCLIWESPRAGEKYVIGADPAEGLGQDRSVVEVNRCGNTLRPDELVCEWCGNANGYEFAPIIHAIANLYTVGGEEPLLAIENNRGDTAQMEMRMHYGWSNFYTYKIYDRQKQQWAGRIGWHTDPSTRPKLLQRAVQHIKNRIWTINSPWLVDELSNFEYDEEKMKMKAATGHFDDRVMASFIALYCSRDWADYDSQVSSVDKEPEGKTVINYQQMDISVDMIDSGYDGMLYY